MPPTWRARCAELTGILWEIIPLPQKTVIGAAVAVGAVLGFISNWDRVVLSVVLFWLLICPIIGGLIMAAKSRPKFFSGKPPETATPDLASRKAFRFGRITWGVIISLVFGPLGWIVVLSTPQGAFWACPACVKWVPVQATKCHHCGSTFCTCAVCNRVIHSEATVCPNCGTQLEDSSWEQN